VVKLTGTTFGTGPAWLNGPNTFDKPQTATSAPTMTTRTRAVATPASIWAPESQARWR